MAENEKDTEVTEASANGDVLVNEEKDDKASEKVEDHGKEEVSREKDKENNEDVKIEEAGETKEGDESVENGKESEEADRVEVKDDEKKETKRQGRGVGKAKEKEEKEKGDAEDKERKVRGGRKRKEPSTPVSATIERPTRERKSVERFVISSEKDLNKEFLIEKGHGTPLKDIPNIAYKLSKRKSDDVLKMLHAIIFGRRGKSPHIKSNISQFSGFVWGDNEEKQRSKIREKLDKCIKTRLLDFCELLDVPVSKATDKKEEIVVKLLEFLESPHATRDVLLAEKEQSSKGKKRKRVVRRSSGKSPSTSAKGSVKRQKKSDGTPKARRKKNSPKEVEEDDHDDEDEEEEAEDQEEEAAAAATATEEEEEEEESPAADEGTDADKSDESDEEPEEKSEDEDAKRGRTYKKSLKKGPTKKVVTRKAETPKKGTPSKLTKSLSKSPSKHVKIEEKADSSAKVFSRKKKNDEKKKKPSASEKHVSKGKTGKKVAKAKDEPQKKEKAGPTEAELRKAICDILKEVDFNTATFTDILKQLAAHFKTDLTPRKAEVKGMIQEELTKLADEADEDEEDGDGEKEDDNEERERRDGA